MRMSRRVIHRRSFQEFGTNKYIQDILEFDTAIDVFNVIHVDVSEGLPTIWYETLDEPIYRQRVVLHLIFDTNYIPDNSFHVGSVKYGHRIAHIYQVRSV